MKRLLAAGYPRLFQICRCWRQGERGRRHLPEYTMLEWYRAGEDYQALMTECEALLGFLAPEGRLNWQGRQIDLTPPWERLTIHEAFARFSGITPEAALAAGRFDEIVALQIEPRLPAGRPVFLTEYPAACAALARRKADNPAVAERFELYLAGLELANAFSELTDPEEQRRRFVGEEAGRRAAGKPASPAPERFLAELGAIDRAAGIALGVDRLVMLLTDSPSIDQVVAFVPEDL
jgi:lysyl-tRNA synthetase class 2